MSSKGGLKGSSLLTLLETYLALEVLQHLKRQIRQENAWNIGRERERREEKWESRGRHAYHRLPILHVMLEIDDRTEEERNPLRQDVVQSLLTQGTEAEDDSNDAHSL